MVTGKVVFYIVLCAVVLAADLEVKSTSNDLNEPYHGSHIPNFPTGAVGDFVHKGHHGHLKPHLENEGSEESHGHHHHHHHDSHHRRHQPQPLNHEELQILQEFEKRRPFYPLVPHVPHYPYYPHYPHNENEDSGSTEQLMMRLLLHPPSFPLNNDNRESIEEHGFYGPFYHGPHNPHAPAIPKVPVSDESVEGSGDSETNRDTVQLTDIPGVPLQKDDDVTEDENEDDLEAQLDEAPYDSRNRLTEQRADHVECDYLNTPRYSCYSCYTYLECKQGGGKIKPCKDPFLPYCNNGVCSATPTIQCASEGYEVDASGDGEVVPLTNIDKNIPLQDDDVTENENQQEKMHEVTAFDLKRLIHPRPSFEVKCDSNTSTKSCYSCYHTMVCSSNVGKVNACTDTSAPYCKNGQCSATPNTGCSRLYYNVEDKRLS